MGTHTGFAAACLRDQRFLLCQYLGTAMGNPGASPFFWVAHPRQKRRHIRRNGTGLERQLSVNGSPNLNGQVGAKLAQRL